MAERSVFHVKPASDGSWEWRLDDDRGSRSFPTREAALADAVRRAERDPNSQVHVYRDEAATEVYRNIVIPPAIEARGVKSRLTIRGHPVHPMIIPFPIGFLALLAVSDVVYWATTDPFWGELSRALLYGGIVTGALAAVLGMVDFLSLDAVRRSTAGWLHLLFNAAVLLLALANLVLRLSDPAANIVPAGVTLSLVVLGLLLVSGVAGNHLVYRHRIGMEPQT